MRNNIQVTCTVLCLFLSTALLAQQQPVESKINSIGKINFAELAQEELQHPPAITSPRYIPIRRESPDGITRNRPIVGNVKVTEIKEPGETNLPAQQASLTTPAPLKSFTGIKDDNTVIPPDVMGAVGPNHLMETLNSFYRVYSKTGSSLLTITPSTFWSKLGTYEGDPHIAYDSLSGRWIHCCIGKLSSTHFAIFVAVSQNSDPRRNWFIYSIDTGPSTTFPDYPLLGFNKKWVVITTNDFVNNSFSTTRIIVLNKSKLLSGTLGTVKTFFDNTIFTLSPAETLDPAQGTEYLLTNYNSNSGGKGYVKIYNITGTTGSPVYNAGSMVGVNRPWSNNIVDEPQKGTTNLIDAGDTRMGKIILRNGSIWASQTVFLPATTSSRSAAQWWQINPVTNTVLQFGRLDDATGTNRFAFPSIAVTASNNVLIGCSLFGSSIFASAAYAYRNSTDAANTLRSFFKYKAGGNTYFKTYSGTVNRWGDYSATCLDYSYGTFWTLQEFATTTANTWGTWWANVGAATLATAIAKNTAVESNFSNALFSISPNPARQMATLRWQSAKPGTALLSIFNTQGAALHTQNIQVVPGINQLNIPIQNLSSGMYVVTLTMENTIQRTKLVVEK